MHLSDSAVVYNILQCNGETSEKNKFLHVYQYTAPSGSIHYVAYTRFERIECTLKRGAPFVSKPICLMWKNRVTTAGKTFLDAHKRSKKTPVCR